jgi:hypothetical protein
VTSASSVFDLPETLSAKRDPALIAADEEHFRSISETLESTIAALVARRDEERRAPGGSGQVALERDLEIHRLTTRLGVLRRFGLDLCLGRIVGDDGSEPSYIGRLGLGDAQGRRLLVDWRSPAAEPFFGATHANPMGLASRRRYRWGGRRILDYWDEVFTPDGLATNAALDDQSAFIASLGTSRSPQMRDVLSTIQADQDAIIRAGSHGALVVDGGPGTGKTVVALHRAAYLLYSEPRLAHGGGLLFVGPHEAYLAYVEDVLPSLGEERVQICTLRDLVPEGAVATIESNDRVAALKASSRLVEAIDAAVAHYERPPESALTVETPWSSTRLVPREWADAFAAADQGTPHNQAREQVWDALVEILSDGLDPEDEEATPERFRRALAQNEDLRSAFQRAWPLLDPVGVVADLLSVPSYLRACAPWLSPEEVMVLQREDPRAWTASDLPLLDAARRRIGDPDAGRRRRRREAELAREREGRDRVIDELIAGDGSDLRLMTMLRGQDVQNSLVDEEAAPGEERDLLAGPFAHIVVDEAQELTDAEWRMLLARCPSGSFTIVGDRAQARHGFAESWEERLGRVGFENVRCAALSINYRTPAEVMGEAEPVIRGVLPDANVPTSIRSTGVPVRYGATHELAKIVGSWLAEHAEGIVCVVGDPLLASGPRMRSTSAQLAKGLEFDLVVLVEPERWGEGIEGAVDRYVAMTRATQELVALTGETEPH